MTLLIGASIFMTGTGPAGASDMGFRFNMPIYPKFFPPPQGDNWIALPYLNPYVTAEDLCVALSLPTGPLYPFSRVSQLDATTGFGSLHECGEPGPFTIRPGVGVLVQTPFPTPTISGIISGSHPSGTSYTILPAGFPPPIGWNYYAVPYNSTAVYAQDLCAQFGLPVGTRISWLDPTLPLPYSTWDCWDPGGRGFELVLGQAVLIRNFAPLSPAITVTPQHF